MDQRAPDRPLLIFDGDCSFCRAWIEYWKQLTGARVSYAPYQEVSGQFPDIAREDFAKAVKFIAAEGEVRSGASAVFATLGVLPEKRWMLSLYQRVPGAVAVSNAAYGLIARHRSFCYGMTKMLWGIPIRRSSYNFSTWLFLRVLGAIFAIAFASFGAQVAGLIGSRGILPAADFLSAVRQYYGAAGLWQVPTLLWWSPADSAIRAIWISGLCLSVLLMLGVNLRLLRLALFVLYLSLTVAGQEFMGYQWDALLLEAGFLAIFLGSSFTVRWLGRWLLFRLIFLSGAVKLLSGDPSWHSFTALPVHYQTQPLPTPLAWYMFQLPGWFQRASVGVVFIVELLVPFLIFAPRRLRHRAAITIVIFEALIFLTGNYAFFNLLAIALCIFLLDDQALGRLLPMKVRGLLLARSLKPDSIVFRKTLCRSFAVLVLFASTAQMAETFTHFHNPASDAVLQAIGPFEIVNTYGLFAVMTTTRPEIVIEGSNDGQTWLSYEFKYKPGALTRRPGWVAPHQPRLDWQMWFAALGDYRSAPWIIHFMGRLLEGSPDVVALLDRNPFPSAPPKHIRAQFYEYRFATPAERKAGGAWWTREWKGSYVSALSLRSP